MRATISADISSLSIAVWYRHTQKEEKRGKCKIGVAQRGRDVATMVSLLLEQSSHLVVAQRTVAASVREQWGEERE